MKNERFSGIENLYGVKAFSIFQKSHILVIGIGGVGSWVAESLCRSGIGHITLVDLDEVCISNTNRQVHTHAKTIGTSKVEAMQKRLFLINPDCKVHIINDFYSKSSAEEIFNQHFDYVIDCMDSVKSKCHLIASCKEKSIPLITTGAAGGKIDPSKIQIADLNRSYNDKLLVGVRKKLKKEYNFPRYKHKKFHIPAVFSPEEQREPEDICDTQGLNCDSGYGSATHITATFGLFATSYVLKELSLE